ncbi:MAG: DUF3307 domain-containing protein [Urechidicola sp.]|nr:DUF3307 domain-containing protein [Urechidicola sp.]
MLALAIKFILAHLMGDFLFQPDKWIANKKKKKHKSPYLYWHLLIHIVLLLIILQFNFYYWKAITLIIISHYIIDLIKLNLDAKVSTQILFFIDQALHIMVILCAVYLYYPFNINITAFFSIGPLLFITAILITTYVSAIIIKILISKWKIKDKSPNQAGKYIGMLERIGGNTKSTLK